MNSMIAVGFVKQAWDSAFPEVRGDRLFMRYDSNKPGRFPAHIKEHALKLSPKDDALHYTGEEEVTGDRRSQIKRDSIALHRDHAEKLRLPLGLHHVVPGRGRRFRRHMSQVRAYEGVRD